MRYHDNSTRNPGPLIGTVDIRKVDIDQGGQIYCLSYMPCSLHTFDWVLHTLKSKACGLERRRNLQHSRTFVSRYRTNSNTRNSLADGGAFISIAMQYARLFNSPRLHPASTLPTPCLHLVLRGPQPPLSNFLSPY
jgi:hypothetical protein